MKKILILALVIGFLLLSGCGENMSVGETDSEKETDADFRVESTEGKKPVRMIKLDGELYYDSGILNNEIKCGTLDGELITSAGEYEIPENNGEANFEGDEYFGYQHATSITKTVSVDGKYTYFKKVPDYGDDLSRYKYVFHITGRHPNAKKDSEFIVLANTTDVTFEQITKYFFSSLLEEHLLDVHIIFPTVYDDWGIMMYAEDITDEGMTLKIEQFGGEADGDLQTGEWFSLEIMDGDTWKAVGTNPLIDYAWNDVAYIIRKNDITEIDVRWKWLYGELAPGYYRVKKEVMNFRGAGDFDKEIYEVDFTVG